jgi:UDP-N-acetylglucosamine 1-carboxyvinyltransferase
VQDLARFLVAMGASIEGIGTNTITIHGGRPLHGCTHEIGPDHIEVGSFIGLAAVTRSEITIERAGVEHPALHADGLRATGRRLPIEATTSSSRPIRSGDSQRPGWRGAPKLEDQPWPAFPADTMSIALVTATQCEGVVVIHEKMFESRLFFVDKLIGMGARIVLCDPHAPVVVGPSKLRGGRVESPDIRAGMAMLLAALCRRGREHHRQRRQIERGYERIDERLAHSGEIRARRGPSHEVSAAASLPSWKAPRSSSIRRPRRSCVYDGPRGRQLWNGNGEPVREVMARWTRCARVCGRRRGSCTATQVHGNR